MRYLITGGSGFIGQNLARRIVARGDRVTALVRPTSDRAALERAGASFAVGDLLTGEGLEVALDGVDRVIHLAGLTKARTQAEYHRCNAEGTRRLVEEMARARRPARLVYCSSLSAAGPSAVNRPRREEETPAPVSCYGRSKLGGERAVREYAERIPSVIVRPPIVYGPADREFLPSLLPMARAGVVLKSGFGPKQYSLIHVDDLCDGLLAASARGRALRPLGPEGIYFLSDGGEYSWEEVCAALARALGLARLRVLPLPDLLSYAAGLGSELHAHLRGTVPILNRDKARELRCDAWTCSPDRARAEIDYTPAFTLDAGLENTIAWYRQEGIL